MQSDAPSSPEPGPQFTGFTTFCYYFYFFVWQSDAPRLQSQVLSFFFFIKSSQRSPRPLICRARGGSRGSLSLDAQDTSGYVSIRQSAYVSIRQHTSAYVSIRQHTSAYVSYICSLSLPAPYRLYIAYVSIRLSPIYSIRQHTSIAYI